MLILNERAESLGLDGAPCLPFLMSRDLLRERECSAHRALSTTAAAKQQQVSACSVEAEFLIALAPRFSFEPVPGPLPRSV